MCGIAGFWDFKRRLSDNEAQNILRQTTDSLQSRGPDASGYHYEKKCGLALGHRRLSIVDLSEAGAQPMESANGRYVITYNGEIYNTDALRSLLSKKGKISFRGHSDTELLIETIDSIGVEKTLKILNGMFSFAVFDRAEDCLYLARDHIGIKPLYWALQNNCLFFASTLTPIMQHKLFEKRLNASCLPDYFSYNTIPAPQTILQDCYKVKQGHYLTIRLDKQPIEKRYWDILQPAQTDDIDFHSLLRQAIKQQMVSDVPLGTFLSGGIDSSLITALMQEQSDKRVQSYTIGFEETSHDESQYAERVAKHLGTHHTQEILHIQKAKDLIGKLPELYDEPFADSSQLPSLLLCQMAKKHVTVCLSGDGGDELFAGYSRYFYGQKAFHLANKAAAIPFGLSVLSMLSKEWINNLPLTPDNLSTKLEKIVLMAKTKDGYDRNKILVDLWINNPASKNPLFSFEKNRSMKDLAVMRHADMQYYLPDDILHKMDRASMAHSLEVRVPFLDRNVIEAAFKIPVTHHYRNKTGKIILRDILRHYIPDDLIHRPKSGFSVPITRWLRKDLKDLIDEFITKEKLEEGGYLDADIILRRLGEHQSGTHSWQHALWGVLMLQMWRSRYNI